MWSTTKRKRSIQEKQGPNIRHDKNKLVLASKARNKEQGTRKANKHEENQHI